MSYISTSLLRLFICSACPQWKNFLQRHVDTFIVSVKVTAVTFRNRNRSQKNQWLLKYSGFHILVTNRMCRCERTGRCNVKLVVITIIDRALLTSQIHCVSQTKMCHFRFQHNFNGCRDTSIILCSEAQSPQPWSSTAKRALVSVHVNREHAQKSRC